MERQWFRVFRAELPRAEVPMMPFNQTPDVLRVYAVTLDSWSVPCYRVGSMLLPLRSAPILTLRNEPV